MAKGYWGLGRPSFCRCCKSGAKAKFCCAICGHVVKAPWEAVPVCPGCKTGMVNMGDKWKPARKKYWRRNAAEAKKRLLYLRSRK